VRRWWLPLAAAALLALGGLVLVEVLRPTTAPTRAEQARLIAAELRCPDCQALSVAESHTHAADAIRAEIAEQLAAGRSVDEVRQHFVDRYGQWILLQPADPLIWLLPVVVVLSGVAVFAWWIRGRRGQAHGEGIDPDRPLPPDEAARRAVRDELEALDG
jgi:cytochrome c-type biogenesis protein CcmH